MSILIKGMDMPKGCDQCRCCVPDDVNSDSASYYCVLNNYIAWNTEHNIPDSIEVGCPLVEIPTPHGDLIDRAAVLCLGNVLLNDTVIHKWAVIKAPAIIEQEE